MNLPPVPVAPSPVTTLGSYARNSSQSFQDLYDPEHCDALTIPDLGQGHPLTNKFRQRQQFQLLDVARVLLPEDLRLRNCHRVRVTTGALVGVYELPWGTVALSNVQTCGRSYCPVCGPRINLRRGNELVPLARNLVGQGCRIFRVDWSHAHAHDMPLTEQVAQQRAFFKAMGSGRHALSQQLQKLGNYFGGWRALDYTHGAGGHHLHAHSALFLDGAASESDLHEVISGAYEVAARKVGLTVGSAGVYVARIGPEGVRYLHKPGLVHARNLTGALIPSQLLLRASEGDAEAAQAWVEYAEAMRGVRKLSTTPGLRARAAHVPVTQDGQDDLLAQVAIPLGANQVRSVAPGTPVPSLTVLANLGLTLRPAWPTRAPRTAARAWPSQHAGAQQRAPQALPL